MKKNSIELILRDNLNTLQYQNIKSLSLDYEDNIFIKYFFFKKYYRKYFLVVRSDKKKVISISKEQKESIKKEILDFNFRIRNKLKK